MFQYYIEVKQIKFLKSCSNWNILFMKIKLQIGISRGRIINKNGFTYIQKCKYFHDFFSYPILYAKIMKIQKLKIYRGPFLTMYHL